MDPYQAIRYYLYVEADQFLDGFLDPTKVEYVELVVRLNRSHKLRCIESL